MCGDYLLITGITYKQIKVQLQFSSMNLTISLNSSFIIDAISFSVRARNGNVNAHK